MTQYTLFDTEIGWAGLAWNASGLVGSHLPEREPDNLRRGFQRRFPGITEALPPESLSATIAGIQALMRGEKADLTGAPLDIGRVPEFNARVYEIARAIPPGETMTYGEIAARLGDKLLARDVGAAMGQNPWPIVVPCHRVTAANGKPGGFSARGGVNTKLKLLTIEGAAFVQPAPPRVKPKPAPAQQADLFG
jgi:methylated-DNA-[protein]-cysteine S-methyltransferase